jgi:hypothetical protein
MQLALLAVCFMLIPCWAYSLTLKMEAICSSRTSVDFYRTIWCYIPKDKSSSFFHMNMKTCAGSWAVGKWDICIYCGM